MPLGDDEGGKAIRVKGDMSANTATPVSQGVPCARSPDRPITALLGVLGSMKCEVFGETCAR
jgi:hypothetical protein